MGLGFSRRSVRAFVIGALLLVSAVSVATAGTLKQGIAAFGREDYVRAATIFIPLAAAGDPVAQAYLGFQFETGRGVPMNYTEAAMWYRRSAEQGYDGAQFSLGLLYSKGQGVPRNLVESSKWLNLAASSSPKPLRETRARIRDAVTARLTRGEIAQSRARALEWMPTPERP